MIHFLFLIFFILKVYETIEVSKNVLCSIEDYVDVFEQSNRLPKHSKPLEYRLAYVFNKELETYTGNLDIDIQILNKTNKIILHSDRNNIISVSLIKFSDQYNDVSSYLEITEICFKTEFQMLMLKLNREMKIGENATIAITFNGMVSKNLNGVYYSFYTTKANETKKVIATHFEPDMARTAFPCFDEPTYKATFVIKLTYPSLYSSLSNTPIEQRTMLDESTLSVLYQPTVIMSTYLVAFVIHDFDSISTISKSGTKINVWLPSDHIESGKFAIELAPKVLDTFEKLFDIPYQLPKLDLIGIPGFDAGAMENWGLVTFRMSSLIVNEKLSTTFAKQLVGQTITHELAHQWFGNLVTMEWWNDIWLNEGFASFMEFYIMNIHFPDWRIMDQFKYMVMLSAMSYDELPMTHPLSEDSEFKENIHLMFDRISYDKGASILLMLMSSLGEETFLKCIQVYLKKFSYSNSDSKNLWEIVKRETKQSFYEDMMSAWTINIGYPLLTIERTNQTGIFNITQERMFISADIDKINKSKEDQSVWTIPIDYITESQPLSRKRVWLSSKNEIFNLTQKDEWVKLNYKFQYFYRTNYDNDIFLKITKSLKNNLNILSSSDKMLMISDIFTMLHLERMNLTTLFEHLEYIRNETDLYVISEFLHNMKYIQYLVIDMENLNKKFQKFILEFSQPIVKNLGWELKGDRFTRLLQTLAISTNIGLEDKESITIAKNLFKKYLDNKSQVDPDMLNILSCAYIKDSGKDEWNRIFELFKTTNDLTEKDIYMFSLSCTKDQNLLRIYLNMSIDEKIISQQDMISVIIDVSRNRFGSLLAWDFVKINWKFFKSKLSDVPNTFSALVSKTAGRLKTVEDFNDVKTFYENNELGFLERGFSEALENIGNNISWLKRNFLQLNEYLSKY